MPSVNVDPTIYQTHVILKIMNTNTNNIEDRNIVIIGGGTAGFAAGVYTSRAMLEPVLITGEALGGQLSLTLDLEKLSWFLR